MPPTVQTILHDHFSDYAQSRRLPPPVHRAAQSMMACRTAVLGGHVQSCPDGHVERIWYNSCKHRCCPQCAEVQMERWLQGTKARLLACPHFHAVFTIPSALHPLWLHNPTVFPSLLFRSVRDTLIELLGSGRYLGALPGMLMSLHTWGRTLTLHPHIHCLISAGGWTEVATWKPITKGYLLPVKVVKALYRGKLLAALGQALAQAQLKLPVGVSSQQQQNLFNQLGRQAWNVRIQGRYEHGQGVLTYLARYVRGGPISNRRLVKVTADEVLFRYTDHRDGRTKPMGLPPAQFLQRLLLHVPEPGSHRVRYYGLYAHGQRPALAACRQQLGQPPIEPLAYLDWQTYWKQRQVEAPTQCPVCGKRLVCSNPFPPGGIPPPLNPVYRDVA